MEWSHTNIMSADRILSQQGKSHTPHTGAIQSSDMFFMLALFRRLGLSSMLIPVWWWVLSLFLKAKVRITVEPEGTWEGGGGGPCQGLLKGSRSLLKTQGGRLLPVAMQQATNCKDKT